MVNKNFSGILIAFLMGMANVVATAQTHSSTYGNSSFEISFGPSTLFGDIGSPLQEKFFYDKTSYLHDPNKLINNTTSFGFHQELSDRFAYKVSVFTSTYEHYDSMPGANIYMSDIFEVAARGEYVLFRWLSPLQQDIYIHAGLGYLYSTHVSTPPASLNPTPTHDQAFVLPFGFGYRYSISNRLKVGTDFNLHYVFNDMIEGRGFPNVTSGKKFPQDFTVNASLTLLYVIYMGNTLSKNCHCTWY